MISLLSISYYFIKKLHLNNNKFGEQLDICDNMNHDIKKDNLYQTVDKFCEDIVTSDCESWDIYTNTIIVEYNGSPQSKVLVYILSKLFNPDNIIIVLLNSRINYIEDFLYQINFRTIYYLNKNTHKKQFFNNLCNKHNTPLVFSSATSDDIAIDTMDMILNLKLNKDIDTYQPFASVSNNNIDDFIIQFNLESNKNTLNESISVSIKSESNCITYDDWMDNIVKFTNEYKYMVKCLDNTDHINKIMASKITRKDNIIILSTDEWYPEIIFNRILDEIIKENRMPRINKNVRRQLYINSQDMTFVKRHWSIESKENTLTFQHE